MSTRAALAPALGALLGGAAVALSLPPWSWWWCAPAGYALFLTVLAPARPRVRVALGAAFGLGCFGVGLAWMAEFSVPGAGIVVLLAAAMSGAATLALPRTRLGAFVGFPALITLTELFRYRWPFGGLPLAGPALGQVDGPFAAVARSGGDFSLVFVAALVGVAVAGAVYGLRRRAGGVLLASGAVAAFVFAVAVASHAVPVPPPTSSRRVAYVQGGGRRGLRAIHNDSAAVYARQIDTTERIATPVDLIVWPEDVVDINGPITDDPVRDDLGQIAKHFGATLVAGVVEDAGPTRFRNAVVAWDQSGRIVDRYDKVHRVPFGEYVPARGLISRLGDVSAVPRDAIAGKGAGLLFTRAGPLGVVISYEVFFAERARVAAAAGGHLLLVPTNAASFHGDQVPNQEIAAARLRAIETGRDVVQVAPTGHSAFIDAHGRVTALSALGAPSVAQHVVRLRTARTPYVRLGERPVVALAVLSLVEAWIVARRRAGSDRPPLS